MTSSTAPLLARVLNALSLNRTPGFHFAGHFLRISFDHMDPQDCRVSMPVGPHNVDSHGALDKVSLSVFADMALASAVRAHVASETRMATVNLQLQFTGRAGNGPLSARTRFVDRMAANPRVALSEGQVFHGDTLVATGTGTFMVLPMPPGKTLTPLQAWKSDWELAAVAPDALTTEEAQIFRAAQQAGGHDGAFAGHFWGMRARALAQGASSRLPVTPQVTNRVGHVQGGILLAQAIDTALATLPIGWGIGGICANYFAPGTGAAMLARATPLHTGRSTAATRIQIRRPDRTRVMEAQASLLRSSD